MSNETKWVDVQLLAEKVEALEDSIDAAFEVLELVQASITALKRPTPAPSHAPQLGCRCYEDR